MNKHPLISLVKEQKKGIKTGICSICSANKYVLEAAMLNGIEHNQDLLIEATCNQVNQFGGYTGMRPEDFKKLVYTIADSKKFPRNKLILAGDHLGPNPWKEEPAEDAMKKSLDMIRLFILAGFTKIHLDASMHLGDDDKTKPLPKNISAMRSAIMCQIAEKTYLELKKIDKSAIAPVYVIGTEVPIPGGMQEEEEKIQITTSKDFNETVEVSKQSFIELGLEDAWERVIAVVVQPGVEFGDSEIVEYDKTKSKNLVDTMKNYSNLIFEGHSTDYQTPKSLKELVIDGVAILKVGPGLTFAVREALFALNQIEMEICKYDNRPLSRFKEIIDMIMLENPKDWNTHYHGSEKEMKLARKYSMSDRSRYYYLYPEVDEAINRLIENLKIKKIPLTLLSQYLPLQYYKVRTKKIKNTPEELIIDCIIQVLSGYNYACNNSKEEYRLA